MYKLPVKPIGRIGSVVSNDRELISLTFDDGWQSDFSIALPLLNKYGFNATFFIITGRVGKKGYLKWCQIRELLSAGMEIGSHTETHPYLTLIPTTAVHEECLRSKLELEDKIGVRVTSISIPYGEYNKNVMDSAIKCGYENICISKPGINSVPLKKNGDIGIRRNSLHRKVRKEALLSIVSPSLFNLLIKEVFYDLRKILKILLGHDLYVKLRKRL
jgi:peptidoglycan/xylan/chitin deacetylase (PgdA/CDA1 family)